MKVCFVSHSSEKGGAERALLELIDALKTRDIEVYVLLPSYGPLIEELKTRGLDFYVVRYHWWVSKKSPLSSRVWRNTLSLAKVVPIVIKIKLWRCDVVYTNTITICVGALAAKLLGLPHVWHIHEFGYEDHGLNFDLGQKFSLWFMNRFSSTCIVISKAVAQKYQRYIPAEKLKVIYQSVNVPQQGTINKSIKMDTEGGISCIILGALREGKRQEDAIRAIAELVHCGIKAQLFIVGESDLTYRQYLEELVIENEINNYVIFTGYLENPFLLMQNVDIILNCSLLEGFGRVTVEAMKIGKPVIGARSGGTMELIDDGFNGLLYNPGDPKDLAKKIRYLYDHPDVGRNIGQNGQHWAIERFTQYRYGIEVLSVLQKIHC